jgi:hypothetical protein
LPRLWQNVDDQLERLERKRPWLCRQTGISLNTLNSWIARDRKPRIDEAYRIARALGTTIEYLVTGINAPPVERDTDLEGWLELAKGRSKEELAELRGVVRQYIADHFGSERKTATGA